MRVLPVQFSELNRKAVRVTAAWLRENARREGALGEAEDQRPTGRGGRRGWGEAAIFKGRPTWKSLRGKFSQEPGLLVTC